MRLLLTFLLCGCALFAQKPAVHLTLAEAEAAAQKNHPQIAIAQDLAAAADQLIVETKSAYYPTLKGEITGSQAHADSVIGAGALQPSLLYSRFGQGLQLDQLIADFGRTRNLVSSSKLQAQAIAQSRTATTYDITLAVDRAYYGVLQAQAFVKVAEQTVTARQALVDQVNALANAQLKSQVDVSFANVSLAEAKLLLLRAQDGVKRANADLTRAMGSESATADYILDEPAMPGLPPADAEGPVANALNDRPELASLNLNLDSARRFEAAERDLKKPKLSLVAIGGYLPYFDQTPRSVSDGYEAVALNLEIPIFNGHLFTARAREAHYRAMAVEHRLADERQEVVRAVRTAVISANTSYSRIAVTEQMMQQANQALDLAQGRYSLGLSSIVEVTQAQLNLTEAQIENAGARYQYESDYAVLQYSIGALR